MALENPYPPLDPDKLLRCYLRISLSHESLSFTGSNTSPMVSPCPDQGCHMIDTP